MTPEDYQTVKLIGLLIVLFLLWIIFTNGGPKDKQMKHKPFNFKSLCTE